MLVTIPRLCRRAHVPETVGLLLGGVIVGPYVLGFFSTDRPISSAQAGPCSPAIAQFEQAVRQSAGNPTAGPVASQ
jgi:hypothetical protein